MENSGSFYAADYGSISVFVMSKHSFPLMFVAVLNCCHVSIFVSSFLIFLSGFSSLLLELPRYDLIRFFHWLSYLFRSCRWGFLRLDTPLSQGSLVYPGLGPAQKALVYDHMKRCWLYVAFDFSHFSARLN